MKEIHDIGLHPCLQLTQLHGQSVFEPHMRQLGTF